ncbi:hypothetical protein ACFL3C_04610 [Patescibacteria group bacterium]
MRKTHSKTLHCYSKPSFLGGMSRILDIGCTIRNGALYDSPIEADAKAIYSDWRAVGEDISFSMKEIC